MKKVAIFFWFLALSASLMSTQLYVVGEVFTATWCGFCPAARSALRQMYDDETQFDYLIPLIWQQDGPYPSPNYAARTSFYSVSGIPHGQWGGHLSYVGGGTATYSNYVNRYNQLVNNPSPIELDVDFEINDQNQLVITADVNMIQSITTTNNKIQFIVSYNLDAEQPGNYFASVMRYNEQNFTLTNSGQTGEFTHTFNIDNWWDFAKAHAIVIIQTFDGNKTIHQAGAKRLSDFIAPSGLVGYPGNEQALLTWNAPNSDIDVLGYNIYRDSVVINDELHLETSYTDTGLQNGTNYSYYVTAVYEDAESGPSNIVVVTPFAAVPGLVQIGSGEAVNSTTQAAPINIYYRSQRGQMVYTANEINMAGFQGPGELTSFGFYVQAVPVHSLPNFHIRIKHTTASNASAHDNGPFELTQVISPSYTPAAGVWDMIELTVPFQWNGVDNILIDTAFDMVPNWNASGQQRVFNTPSGYRYVWSDTSNQTNAATTTTADYKPQIRLQFIDEPEDFPAPQNLTAIAGEGYVELSWDAPAMPRNPVFEGYNVYRDGLVINDVLVEETGYTDADGEYGVTYTYYVTAVYDEGESNPSNSVEVTLEPPVLHPPTDLTYYIQEETTNVHLMWEAPSGGEGTAVEMSSTILNQSPDLRSRELLGYNVYRDDVVINDELVTETIYIDLELAPDNTYVYYVTAVYTEGESEPSNIAEVYIEGVNVDNDFVPVMVNSLGNNYPNPFNPETTISFSLAQAGQANLEIYNSRGQKVRTLLNGFVESGEYRVVWNGNDDSNNALSSGIYFYKIKSGSFTASKKMILLK